MHFAIQTMSTSLNQISTLVNGRPIIWKHIFEYLIIWMTKSHVPQWLIKNNRLRHIVTAFGGLITDFGRQVKLGSSVRIDAVNSIFTLALV